MIAIVEVVYIAGTVLAIALLGIVGLIEMAATRRWRWLAGLLAAMALIVAAILLPFFYRSLPYNLQNLPVLFFSPPNYPILLGWLWLVCEAVVLLVCAGFGVRATWFRSQPAARA